MPAAVRFDVAGVELTSAVAERRLLLYVAVSPGTALQALSNPDTAA
jgi:hypothetical protein